MIPTLGKGGAEKLIGDLSSELSLNPNVSVTILMFQQLFEDEYNLSRINSKVRIVTLIPTGFGSTRAITRLARVILYLLAPIISIITFIAFRVWSYDVVHINLMLSSVYAVWWVLLARIVRCKRPVFIETFHSNWHLLRWYQKLIFRISWSVVDKVICEIGDSEVQIVKHKSFARDIGFIPFGVPEPEKKDAQFQERFIQHHLGSSWHEVDDKMVIMTIATLNNFKKRFDCILKALAIVKGKGISDFEYWICGDGPDRGLIEGLIDEFDLRDQVKILGFVDAPQQVVYLADLFIVAMVEGYLGVAGLQAGMAGIPVIGVQTVPGYVGKDDAIWSAENPEDIAQKIIELQDESVRLRYALSVQTYVKNRYDIERFYSSYYALFSKEARLQG